MNPLRLVPAMLVLFAAASARPALSTERSQVPEKLKWDLRDLYPSVSAWQAAKAAVEKKIPTLAKHQGHLADSSGALARALDAIMAVDQDLERVYTYASQTSDEDTRISKHLAMKQSADQIVVTFNSTISYVRPELLAAGAEKIRGFVARDPRLAKYRHYLDDILRRAPHTLSEPEEKIVAQAGRMSGAGGSIRDLFVNAEFPYPEVTLSTGEKVRLNQAGYTLHRAAPNRKDRIAVFKAFWGAHKDFQGTLGSALNEQVQAHVFNKDARKFKTCLEAAMFSDNIPTKVYTQLVADVNANLPTFHRYLRLRKKMMGVDTLRYEDLYAPIVKSVKLEYTPEQATDLVLASSAPLGEEYVTTLRRGLTEERWTDWLPNTGKAGGAYSTGAYGIHPYQLQNFTGLYEEVSTLAHESGHSMHTWLAMKHQPYVTYDYATFVAEVASTLNENLLLHYMLDGTQDRPTQLYLLGNYLDNLRGTLFRQTLFAEFELKIHELAEKGETLTGESMSKLYLDLVRKYYGHAQKVSYVDDVIAYEWAYIDHFFYNFYVYQYATSIVAGTTLANAIHDERAKDPDAVAARDRYLNLLRAGGSKYPIDLLKDAGVDMTTSVPFKAAMREMNAVMDRIEKLLAEERGGTRRTTSTSRTGTTRR
jgi:oligoendopeptidase F